MSNNRPMECPECGEDAVRQPAEDTVPWQAHGIPPPGWSHRDGTCLCPVPGTSGGYQPAEPRPRDGEPNVRPPRLDPPAIDRQPRKGDAGHLLAGPTGSEARQPNLRPPTRAVDSVGTRYMRRLIAGLEVPHSSASAHRSDPDREAGA
jgi:hypothetical protein